jgi:hypothetical protein
MTYNRCAQTDFSWFTAFVYFALQNRRNHHQNTCILSQTFNGEENRFNQPQSQANSQVPIHEWLKRSANPKVLAIALPILQIEQRLRWQTQ